jgi:hypothetical protein
MSPTTSLRPLLRGLTLAAVALVAACGGESGGPTGPSGPNDPGPTAPTSPDPNPAPDTDPDPVPVPGIEGRAIFGLTCANQLVLFGSGNPETLARQVPITGMGAGAAMLGIDFRGGALYGIGSDARMYTVDTLTGAATAVGSTLAPAPAGEHFGLAYDAGSDRLHLGAAEGNGSYLVGAETGAMTVQPELAYAAGDAHAGTDPAVVGNAYFGPALFGIESNANALVKVGQETGAVTTVADLPFNVYVCSGIDVDSDGMAYAALATDSGSELYTIDLSSGATELLGSIAGSPVHSIALRP